MATPSQEPEPGPPAWHVLDHGKKVGPLGEAELAAMIAARKLRPKAMAWKRGMQEWLPCSSIPELARLFPKRARPNIPNPLPALIPKIKALIPKIQRSTRNVKARHLANVGIPLVALICAWVWWHYIHVPSGDEFISTFTAESSGKTEELVKVEKRGGTYFLAQKQDGRWNAEEPMHLMGSKEFAQLFGKDWKDANPLGLVNGDGKAAILKVKSGWSTDKFACTTGFFLMKLSGPTQLSKLEERTLPLPSLARKEPESTPTVKAAAIQKDQATTKTVAASGQTQTTGSDKGGNGGLVASPETKTAQAQAPSTTQATVAASSSPNRLDVKPRSDSSSVTTTAHVADVDSTAAVVAEANSPRIEPKLTPKPDPEPTPDLTRTPIPTSTATPTPGTGFIFETPIEQYNYSGGTFVHLATGWKDIPSSGLVQYRLIEKSRNAAFIILADSSRKMQIRLPLGGGECSLLRDNETDWQLMYRVTRIRPAELNSNPTVAQTSTPPVQPRQTPYTSRTSPTPKPNNPPSPQDPSVQQILKGVQQILGR